jgi:hypothetical protein
MRLQGGGVGGELIAFLEPVAQALGGVGQGGLLRVMWRSHNQKQPAALGELGEAGVGGAIGGELLYLPHVAEDGVETRRESFHSSSTKKQEQRVREGGWVYTPDFRDDHVIPLARGIVGPH